MYKGATETITFTAPVGFNFNTADEIEVGIIVNNIKVLTFKKSLAGVLHVKPDTVTTNLCYVYLTHEQSALLPTGRMEAQLTATRPPDDNFPTGIFTIDRVFVTNVLASL